MTVAPQAETEIVQGIVQGVVAKPDSKWQIEVNIGQQNPRRLWTKDEGLVQTMMGMIGMELAFQCGVSHWTNSQQQPVRSLWINGYGAPGAPASAPVVPQPPVVPQAPQVPQYQAPQPAAYLTQGSAQQAAQIAGPQAPNAYEKDQRIMREAASKVAGIMLSHLAEDQRTFTNLIRISERLVAYYENGAPGMNYPLGTDDGAPPAHTDDDIPF